MSQQRSSSNTSNNNNSNIPDLVADQQQQDPTRRNSSQQVIGNLRSSPSQISVTSSRHSQSAVVVVAVGGGGGGLPSIPSPALSRQSSTNSLKGSSASMMKNPLSGRVVFSSPSNNNNNNNRNSVLSTEDSIESLPRQDLTSPSSPQQQQHESIPIPSNVVLTIRNTNNNNNNNSQQPQQQQHRPSIGDDVHTDLSDITTSRSTTTTQSQSNANVTPPNAQDRSALSPHQEQFSFGSHRPPAIVTTTTTTTPDSKSFAIPTDYSHRRNNNFDDPSSPANPSSAVAAATSPAAASPLAREDEGGSSLFSCSCCRGSKTSWAKPTTWKTNNNNSSFLEHADGTFLHDERDWADYFRAPKGVGTLITESMKFATKSGVWLHVASALLCIGMLVAAVCLFLLDDDDYGNKHPYKVLISVFTTVPILFILKVTHQAVTIAFHADEWIAKALQYTIINALTQPNQYKVYLSGLRQTDARILWAADSLSNAAPFLDQAFIQNVCQGPPPNYQEIIEAAIAQQQNRRRRRRRARSQVDREDPQRLPTRTRTDDGQPHSSAGSGRSSSSCSSSSACSSRGSCSDDSSVSPSDDDEDEDDLASFDFRRQSAVFASSSGNFVVGFRDGGNGSSPPQPARHRRHRRHRTSSPSATAAAATNVVNSNSLSSPKQLAGTSVGLNFAEALHGYDRHRRNRSRSSGTKKQHNHQNHHHHHLDGAGEEMNSDGDDDDDDNNNVRGNDRDDDDDDDLSSISDSESSSNQRHRTGESSRANSRAHSVVPLTNSSLVGGGGGGNVGNPLAFSSWSGHPIADAYFSNDGVNQQHQQQQQHRSQLIGSSIQPESSSLSSIRSSSTSITVPLTPVMGTGTAFGGSGHHHHHQHHQHHHHHQSPSASFRRDGQNANSFSQSCDHPPQGAGNDEQQHQLQHQQQQQQQQPSNASASRCSRSSAAAASASSPSSSANNINNSSTATINAINANRRVSLIRTVTQSARAFATSKVPYQNTAVARSVVVCHFAFYYNRHGPHRPPPSNSANEIVKEFVSNAIHSVVKFKGQIYSICPNVVVAYWEVGVPQSSSSGNSPHTLVSPCQTQTQQHQAQQLTSSLSCEFNACSASKEFSTLMKAYRVNVLKQFAADNFASSPAQTQCGAAPSKAPPAGTTGAGARSFRSPSVAAVRGRDDESCNNNNNNNSNYIREPSCIAILGRSLFTVGIAKGTVLKGSIGTQHKLSAQLFGPVVQKAAILAEVGVKVQASVVLTSSIYFANNMTFMMRPIEDLEMPKWLTENRLGGRTGGGGAQQQQQQQPPVSPFRVLATPNPEQASFQNAAAGSSTAVFGSASACEGSTSIVASSAPGSALLAPSFISSSSSSSSRRVGSQPHHHHAQSASSPSSAVAAVSPTSAATATRQQQQQQQMMNALGNEIETVYQLLSVRSSGESNSNNNINNNNNIHGSNDRENEWMYLLERNGGAQLHDMAVAFDSFRSGNLNVAATLFAGLSLKARQSNVVDRYVSLRCRQLQMFVGNAGAAACSCSGPTESQGENRGGGTGTSGTTTTTVSMAMTKGNTNNNNNNSVTAFIEQFQFSDNSSLGSFPADSAAILNALNDISRGTGAERQSPPTVFAGSGGIVGGGGAGTSQINPRRQGLETLFKELKEFGAKYGRKVHVTGVDDFPFE